MFDTAGGERFRTLTSNYYFKTDAALLMYSVEDSYSFERLQEEIENAARFLDIDDLVWALVGNKCDLPIEIEESRIEARCEQLHTDLKFFTSAKTGENVLTTLESVITYVHEQKTSQCAPRGNSFNLAVQQPVISLSTKKQKSCCSSQ